MQNLKWQNLYISHNQKDVLMKHSSCGCRDFFLSVLACVGGAIEIALTEDKDDSDSASLTSSALTASLHPRTARHISKHILGYICLFGNTILTVSYKYHAIMMVLVSLFLL